MKTNSQYPIKKFDDLNRLVYCDWNGVERMCNKYCDDTDKIKIKYRFFGKDVTVEAYDKEGVTIITHDISGCEVNLGRLKIYRNGELYFKVDAPIMKTWKNHFSERTQK